jgi:hypothetical protein
MATDRDIMAKLFLADRVSGDRPGQAAFDRFLGSLNLEEARHPLAAWIARKRAALDWDENVCDMVSRYFGIPQKPLWAAESANGYAEAAERLERELTGQALTPR